MKGAKTMLTGWTGKPLYALRTDKDLSQRELAEKVNISPCMISGYERDNKTPSVETVIKFAELFQVSTDFLLGLTDLKTLPSLLQKEFADGKTYNDVMEMMETLTAEQREILLGMAKDMKFVTDIRNHKLGL